MATKRKKNFKRKKNAGAAPGTLVHVGQQRVDAASISLIEYSNELFEEIVVPTVVGLTERLQSTVTNWINVNGLHDISLIEQLGSHFAIHPLVLEDCLNTSQRPKLDDYDTYVFIVLKMLYSNESTSRYEEEQISIILGENFVVSFQEREGDVFAPIRDRMRAGRGRIRTGGPAYLVYALIDAVVDNYFYVLDDMNDHLEALDHEVIEAPTPSTLQDIYILKREIIQLRRSIVPLRDVIGKLQKGEPKLIDSSTGIYFSDVYDHLLQVVESIDSQREMISSLIELYLTSISNKTTEIMKVLTLMAAIFIPITFVAGVYGMNFNRMPELNWKYGYAYAWCIMLAIAVSMILYFKKKKWL
jgi:magnesium transporter